MALAIALVVGIYLVGPRQTFEPITIEEDAFVMPIAALDNYVSTKESKVKGIKPGNESRIVWADPSNKTKTKYSIVYLHGFSASPMEGNPSHIEIAKRYGCNLYIPRLKKHGIEGTEAFVDLEPDELLDDAKEAIDIGRILGDSLIVMSCSTGGTYTAYLGAKYPDLFDVALFYSPNFKIYDPLTTLLTKPWGLQIARQVKGGNYHLPTNSIKEFWYDKYRLEGVVAIQKLIENTMTDEIYESFEKPYFLGCYFRDKENSDHIVSVDEMNEFYQKSKTPKDKRRFVAFPDVEDHVLLSNLKTFAYPKVLSKTYDYLEEVIGMTPVPVNQPTTTAEASN